MGKDINGRIKVAALDTMPHALIAGSTGSGKSVMINSLIMSILYKSTPDEVRMIMVDPKRVELGMYEGIPHLLTPRHHRSEKSHQRAEERGARNGAPGCASWPSRARAISINTTRKFANCRPNRAACSRMKSRRRKKPSRCLNVLILIDELADLMMLEGRNVEESVTRLAADGARGGYASRARDAAPERRRDYGHHQSQFPRPHQLPASPPRVDSRTILDGMGAEHLLGKGDMLFLAARVEPVHARPRRVCYGE